MNLLDGARAAQVFIRLGSLAAFAACASAARSPLPCTPLPAQSTTAAEPAPAPVDFCSRIAPGTPSGEDPPRALSATHVGLRFFGPHSRYLDIDQRLVTALSPALEVAQVDLRAYVAGLEWACALDASTSELGPAGVTRVGNVAVVRPGKGSIDLPSDADAVVLDLRDLPDGPGLAMVLRSAIAPALGRALDAPYRRMRRYHGMGDEVSLPHSVLGNDVAEWAPYVDDSHGPRERKVAVLVGARLPSAAAELAGNLRLARRAWLFGADVLAAVAESRWNAVGAHGIAWRDEDLLDDRGQRWPDVIAADGAESTPEAVAAALSSLGEPPPVAGPARRAELRRIAGYFRDKQPPASGLAELEASLLIAHGAAREFFSYMGVTVTPAQLDAKLLEMLQVARSTSPIGPAEMRSVLRRFGSALAQQHQRVLGLGGGVRPGYVPILFEWIDSSAIVRRSGVDGIRPGDSLVSIDDEPIAAYVAREAQETSAANEGSRHSQIMDGLTWRKAATRLGLRDTAGRSRMVTVTPRPWRDGDGLSTLTSTRPEGRLSDLGGKDLYYINLSGEVLRDHDRLVRALEAARTGRGLVLDMRDYPGDATNECVRRVLGDPMPALLSFVPERTGLELQLLAQSIVPADAALDDPSYHGPIALLVGPRTVSWAETIALELVDAHRVVVVGRQSGGDDGVITGVQLPGGYGFTFTGSQVRHADGRRFEGEGIVADVPVRLAATDLAAGRDPELVAAVAALSAPTQAKGATGRGAAIRPVP